MKFKRLLCVLLCASILALSSCGIPSREYREGQKKGWWPYHEQDFPNTKWVCRELDLYFSNFTGNDPMIGEYVSNEETYRLY